MPLSISARLAIAFLLFVSALAVWKGRTPERIGGIATALNEAFYLAFYHPGDDINPQWEAMIIDAVFAAVLVVVAIRWNRGWAKWAAAFELLIVGLHVATALDLRIYTYFTYWGAALLTIAALWALLIGTLQVIWQDRRARRALAVTG